MSVNQYDIENFFSRTLDEQTLGLRNRKQKKMVIFSKLSSCTATGIKDFREDRESSHTANTLTQDILDISQDSNNTAGSFEVQSKENTEQQAQNKTPSLMFSKTSQSKDSYISSLNKFVASFFGHYSDTEKSFIRKTLLNIIPTVKFSKLAMSGLYFLNQASSAGAAPISDYAFIEGSSNCTLIQNATSTPISNCKQFQVIWNGTKIISGFLYKGTGRFDLDPEDGDLSGYCNKVFENCFSYETIKAWFGELFQLNSATDYLNTAQKQYICGVTQKYNPGACPSFVKFSGFNQQGCNVFAGARIDVPWNYFDDCELDVRSDLLKAGEARMGKYVGIALGSLVAAGLVGYQINKRMKVREQRKEEINQRKEIHRQHLVAADTILSQTRGIDGRYINPVPIDLLRIILQFLSSDKILNDIVVTEANDIHGFSGYFPKETGTHKVRIRQ